MKSKTHYYLIFVRNENGQKERYVIISNNIINAVKFHLYTDNDKIIFVCRVSKKFINSYHKSVLLVIRGGV